MIADFLPLILDFSRPALIAKKYTPTAKIAALKALADSLTTGKGDQEQKKTDRSNATGALLSAKDALYRDVNNTLEGALGLMGKNTAFADEVHRLRAELYGPGHENNGDDNPDNPPPTPPPTPPATPS